MSTIEPEYAVIVVAHELESGQKGRRVRDGADDRVHLSAGARAWVGRSVSYQLIEQFETAQPGDQRLLALFRFGEIEDSDLHNAVFDAPGNRFDESLTVGVRRPRRVDEKQHVGAARIGFDAAGGVDRRADALAQRRGLGFD